MPELPAPDDWYALPELDVQEGEPTVVLVLKLGMMIAFDDRRDESEIEREARERYERYERDLKPEPPEDLLPTATIETPTGPRLVRLPRELTLWALARNRSWEFGWEPRFPGYVLFNRIDGTAEATVVDGP